MSINGIGAWLEQLGCGKYAEVFSRQAIDTDILPALTDADLEKLGIPLGDRKRLLRAIVRPDARSAPSPAEPPEEPDRRTGSTARAAERRQLTVLFCDLVGSSALAARLDPEDLREVIGSYHRCAAEVLARFEGYVAQFLGDGALAYFGYPGAHEDDPERAVRAGLALIESVGRLTTRDDLASLQVRVGIATGPVVVSDVIAENESGGRAIGETPNTAARLQALAEPGRVAISETTRRLVSGLFEVTDLGLRWVKGLNEPIRAWQVLGASAAESRFEARQAAGLTPLVGREHELGLLMDRWLLANDGEGQVVLLSGQSGIGKSRILQAFREQLGSEPHTCLSHFCSPYHANSALHPVIALLERAGRLSRADPPEQQLDRLAALLALATDDLTEALPLIADLLAIPTGERYPPLNLSPQRRKERTLAALIEQLDGLARRQPVLALYEDVHWIDPTSLELLELVVARVQTLPVLVVITCRPEFAAPWSGHAHVTSLSLSPLGRRQVADMVERITAGKHLPTEVLDQILDRTDGVPLFVEELTKSVLESGLLKDAGDGFELAGRVPPLAIPASLHDSLTARLDRLAPVKEIAQIGAAIGREFSYGLLAAVADRADAEISSALDQLVSAGLVFRHGTPPEADYRFKHALVQDAAYQSLLKSRRQQLHARIAQVLEQTLPRTIETRPELLAHHFTQAGLAEKAIAYWRTAGQQALARSATIEAVAQLTNGLRLLEGVPQTSERAHLELELQTTLGAALIAAKGFAASETGEAFARARQLCRQLGAVRDLFPVMHGEFVYYLNRGQFQAAARTAREFLDLADQQSDPAPVLVGHRVVGVNEFFLGRFTSARRHAEQALARYDPKAHSELALLYVYDPYIACCGILSLSDYALGGPEAARVWGGRALAKAEALGHPGSSAYALFFACLLDQLLCDSRALESHASAMITLADDQGFPFWLGHAMLFHGWALAYDGQTDKGLTEMRRGIAIYQSTSAQLWLPYVSGRLAEMLGRSGDVAEAAALCSQAIEQMESGSERCFEAELRRLHGSLWLSAGEPEKAKASLGRAIHVARRQQATSLELRAALDLGHLFEHEGRFADSQELLAGVRRPMTDGVGSCDLEEARTLCLASHVPGPAELARVRPGLSV